MAREAKRAAAAFDIEDDVENLGLDEFEVEADAEEEEVEEVIPLKKRRGRPPKALLTEVESAPVEKKGRASKGSRVEEVKIPELRLEVLNITVRGTSPLICHRFSTKSKEQMRAKQAGEPKHKKSPKVAEDDFKESLYPVPGKKGVYGFPASAFKLAAVSACRHVEGMKMTQTLGAFHVMGDLAIILDTKGKPGQPKMREDIVRLNSGPRPVADIRYRGEFTEWQVNLTIQYNAAVINPSQIANLLNVAGFAVGVGEWRPEKKGSFGMFSVANNK